MQFLTWWAVAFAILLCPLSKLPIAPWRLITHDYSFNINVCVCVCVCANDEFVRELALSNVMNSGHVSGPHFKSVV